MLKVLLISKLDGPPSIIAPLGAARMFAAILSHGLVAELLIGFYALP